MTKTFKTPKKVKNARDVVPESAAQHVSIQRSPSVNMHNNNAQTKVVILS
jgi:hypothetical protein